MTEILPTNGKVLRGFFWKSGMGLQVGDSCLKEIDFHEALCEIGDLMEANDSDVWESEVKEGDRNRMDYRVITFDGGDHKILFEFKDGA